MFHMFAGLNFLRHQKAWKILKQRIVVKYVLQMIFQLYLSLADIHCAKNVYPRCPRTCMYLTYYFLFLVIITFAIN